MPSTPLVSSIVTGVVPVGLKLTMPGAGLAHVVSWQILVLNAVASIVPVETEAKAVEDEDRRHAKEVRARNVRVR
jgi:hypothetical protein